MSNWPSETSTPYILPSDVIEPPPETQSNERQCNLNIPNMIETLSETQLHKRHDISQHIGRQNADNKRVGPDLGESSGVKTRKMRSKVWEHFEKYKDENGKDLARCKVCEKDFNGSSKLGTTHLKNHFKSCQRKRNGGGGGDNLAGNLSDTITIKEKSVMDQQLNHLVSDEARMIITEERSKQVHDVGRACSIEGGPSHSLQTIKLGYWGASGGTAWDFNSGSNAAIKDIVINHGLFVDSVTFTSIDRTTREIIATATFGGTGGEPDRISINWPEEYLRVISGTIIEYSGRTVIESLNFHTNRKIYGPYGYTKGIFFGTPLENGEIVGFFGRAGLYLDAIGFYVIPSAD